MVATTMEMDEVEMMIEETLNRNEEMRKGGKETKERNISQEKERAVSSDIGERINRRGEGEERSRIGTRI